MTATQTWKGQALLSTSSRVLRRFLDPTFDVRAAVAHSSCHPQGLRTEISRPVVPQCAGWNTGADGDVINTERSSLARTEARD